MKLCASVGTWIDIYIQKMDQETEMGMLYPVVVVLVKGRAGGILV